MLPKMEGHVESYCCRPFDDVSVLGCYGPQRAEDSTCSRLNHEDVLFIPQRLEVGSIRVDVVAQQSHRGPRLLFAIFITLSMSFFMITTWLPCLIIISSHVSVQSKMQGWYWKKKGGGWWWRRVFFLSASLLRGKYFHGVHEGTGIYLFISCWQEQEHTVIPSYKGVWKMSAWF